MSPSLRKNYFRNFKVLKLYGSQIKRDIKLKSGIHIASLILTETKKEKDKRVLVDCEVSIEGASPKCEIWNSIKL